MTGSGPKELIRLEIPALPAFVGVARVVVASVATTVDGIDDGRLEDLRIAVSEACTSAVEIHLDNADDQRVVLRCVLDGDTLAVHIEDSGSGFHLDNFTDSPTSREQPGDGDGERGWGLQLIRALVDDVDFSAAQSGTGSSVRLVVRRDGAT